MRVALSAGHHPDARGACHHNRCEHELAAEWCAVLGSILHGEAEVFHVPTGQLADKVHAINEAECDLAIEFHFNSCGGCGAWGAETLYCPGSVPGEEAATIIQAAMMEGGAMKDRGVKEGWYQMNPIKGPDYFLRHTNCPAVIIEPEFIDQYHRIEHLRDAICEAIAVAVTEILAEM